MSKKMESESNTGQAGVTIEAPAIHTKKITGSHVYVLSTVQDALLFRTKGTTKVITLGGDSVRKPMGDAKPIVTIAGTHTNCADRFPPKFKETVVKAAEWEAVLEHNKNCIFFKNNNIKWFNTKAECLEAMAILDACPDWGKTGLEKIEYKETYAEDDSTPETKRLSEGTELRR